MKLAFTKMHGLGNDFVVLDATRAPLALTRAQWRFIADRHFGVGADQILVVEAPRGADTDFRYRIFNADGGEVEQCGNGARCFVRFVVERGLTTKRSIRVETLGGIIEPRLEDDGRVTVDMGVPALTSAAVHFDVARATATGDPTRFLIDVAGESIDVTIVSMGNPHAVQVVDDVLRAPVGRMGPLVEAHPAFRQRVNAGFMAVESRHALHLRVYERGAGETLSCGSGACAALVAATLRGLVDGGPVSVATTGGDLTISWGGPGRPVMMTGPAATVFEGSLELPSAATAQGLFARAPGAAESVQSGSSAPLARA
ncbi:MAG: diaminopimelate epimerase [Burkholderiales bacterium]|nr:diaminopimelate epimerase [Burkholderiales bacterium]